MYKVTVNLLPQDATLAEKQQVLEATHVAKETMLQSADDAVFLVNNGSQGSRVKVWWKDRWSDPIVPWLLNHGVQIVEVHPVPPPLPGPNPNVLLGLHASADPGDIGNTEFNEFKVAKPGVIKVLSAHAGPSVARLAAENPQAVFVIRAFLVFGDRVITPDEFFAWTKDDVLRTLANIPAGREVVLEIHNEPNLAPEGLYLSWADGYAFASWLDAVVAKFRALQGNLRVMYPGLSPGGYIPGLRQEHIQFIEQSRLAVDNCDALGVHVYWSDTYPMSAALGVLDDYRARFPGKEIWITEASHNQRGPSAQVKAQQYVQFWNALKSKPNVRGVTYYVASATNPAFGWATGSCETWVEQGVSLGMGTIVGAR